MWREIDNWQECHQNCVEVSKYARRFHRGHWTFLGLGLEKTWYKTCLVIKPNREWDKNAASMILPLVTESRHPVFRASSPFERGELDIREYGKKSTRFSDNDRNIELLLRTIKSVNQLSFYEFIAHWSKNLDEDSVDRKSGWNLPHTSSWSSSSWTNSSWQNWNSWWWHSSKLDEGQWVTKFFQHAVSDCRNVVPINRREDVHKIHTPSVHHEHYSLLTSTNLKCVRVAPSREGWSRIVSSLCA